SMLDVVRPLLDTGVGGAEFACAFEAAAEEVLGTAPALAARFYAAAVAAGGDELELSARWARASALAGDLDAALPRADRVIGSPDAPRRTEAAQVAAVVLGCHGQSDRSAELLRWAGDSTSTAFAAIALLGVGRRAEQPAPAADDGP